MEFTFHSYLRVRVLRWVHGSVASHFFYEIMTGRPINQQQRADMRCPRKVTLPIKNIKN